MVSELLPGPPLLGSIHAHLGSVNVADWLSLTLYSVMCVLFKYSLSLS